MPQLSSWRGTEWVRTPGVPVSDTDMNAAMAYTIAEALAQAKAGGGGVSSIEFAKVNQTIPGSETAGNQVSFLAYQVTDPADLDNLLLVAVSIKDVTGNGSKYSYAVWSGDPVTNPAGASKLFDGPTLLTGGGNYNTDFSSPTTNFLDNDALRKGVYLVFTNKLNSQAVLGFKLEFLKFPPNTNPIDLPEYVPGAAFVYTGPSGLTACDVGPGQTFPEPRDAMPYLAPGFVMTVHPGTYYHAFYIPVGMDGWLIQGAPGTTAEDITFNGRGGWVTGYPLWQDDNPNLSGPPNPFRLSQGKGFILTISPGTVRGIGFWWCGGGYGDSVKDSNGQELNLGQGEGAIYCERFAAEGLVHVDRCTFDGCGNGIFIPAHVHNSDGTTIWPGENVRLLMTFCDFSYSYPNGLTLDGLTHNVYVNGLSVEARFCNFFDCNGNSFKSRSPSVTLADNMMSQGYGRAIDFPEGGSLTATNIHFTQKAYPSGGTRIHNFIGVANENQNNGAGIAQFTYCFVEAAYEASFYLAQGDGLANDVDWIGTAVSWFQPSATEMGIFDYDVESNGAIETGVHGILGAANLPVAPPAGTVFTSGYPVRPTDKKHLMPAPAPHPVLYQPDPPPSGQAFTIYGELVEYYALPNITLSIDGGPEQALPSGSIVGSCTVSIPFPNGITGPHSYRLTANGTLGNTINLTTGATPQSEGWQPGQQEFTQVARGSTYTILPTILNPSFTPTQVDVAIATPNNTPSSSYGTTGSPQGFFQPNAPETTNGDGSLTYPATFTVDPATPVGTVFNIWMFLHSAGTKSVQDIETNMTLTVT